MTVAVYLDLDRILSVIGYNDRSGYARAKQWLTTVAVAPIQSLGTVSRSLDRLLVVQVFQSVAKIALDNRAGSCRATGS